jgi:uncharacterized protein YdeI (YjbR/CyaY-like superfamily)
MEEHKGLPVLEYKTEKEFEQWVGRQRSDAAGAWIKFAKKNGGGTTLTKAQAIDVALCHGWIDGQLDKYDEIHWLIRFTPRKPRSKWSEVNRRRASELMEAGRVRPGGLAQIKAAEADGRWEKAYAPASTAEIPADLQDALTQSPKAAAFFATLKGANRYAILYRIGAAKRPETRARKIAEFVAMLERGETLHG